MLKFKTKHGTLTVYALACGYQETHYNNGIDTVIYMEHGAYHVRQWDYNKHERTAWNTFDTIAQARKDFNDLKGK